MHTKKQETGGGKVNSSKKDTSYLTRINKAVKKKREAKHDGMANYSNFCAYLDEENLIVLLREIKNKHGEKEIENIKNILTEVLGK